MSKGNGFSPPEDDVMYKERRAAASTWEKWEGPIKTALPIILSLFLTWHQIEERLDLQEQRLQQVQKMAEINQNDLEKKVDLLETRIYELTKALQKQVQ